MQDSLEDYIRIANNIKNSNDGFSGSQQQQVTLDRQKQCEDYAQKVVEFLIDGKLQPQIFLKSLNFINQEYYQDIVEERVITNHCGYAVCGKKLPAVPVKQYHISSKLNKVYDITERKNYCSNYCYQASSFIKKQIDTGPLWLRRPEDFPKFVLLNKSESVSPGVEIDHGIAKIPIEPTFTSVTCFTEACLDEAEELAGGQLTYDSDPELNIKSILKKRTTCQTYIDGLDKLAKIDKAEGRPEDAINRTGRCSKVRGKNEESKTKEEHYKVIEGRIIEDCVCKKKENCMVLMEKGIFERNINEAVGNSSKVTIEDSEDKTNENSSERPTNGILSMIENYTTNSTEKSFILQSAGTSKPFNSTSTKTVFNDTANTETSKPVGRSNSDFKKKGKGKKKKVSFQVKTDNKEKLSIMSREEQIADLNDCIEQLCRSLDIQLPNKIRDTPCNVTQVIENKLKLCADVAQKTSQQSSAPVCNKKCSILDKTKEDSYSLNAASTDVTQLNGSKLADPTKSKAVEHEVCPSEDNKQKCGVETNESLKNGPPGTANGNQNETGIKVKVLESKCKETVTMSREEQITDLNDSVAQLCRSLDIQLPNKITDTPSNATKVNDNFDIDADKVQKEVQKMSQHNKQKRAILVETNTNPEAPRPHSISKANRNEILMKQNVNGMNKLHNRNCSTFEETAAVIGDRQSTSGETLNNFQNTAIQGTSKNKRKKAIKYAQITVIEDVQGTSKERVCREAPKYTQQTKAGKHHKNERGKPPTKSVSEGLIQVNDTQSSLISDTDYKLSIEELLQSTPQKIDVMDTSKDKENLIGSVGQEELDMGSKPHETRDNIESNKFIELNRLEGSTDQIFDQQGDGFQTLISGMHLQDHKLLKVAQEYTEVVDCVLSLIGNENLINAYERVENVNENALQNSNDFSKLQHNQCLKDVIPQKQKLDDNRVFKCFDERPSTSQSSTFAAQRNKVLKYIDEQPGTSRSRNNSAYQAQHNIPNSTNIPRFLPNSSKSISQEAPKFAQRVVDLIRKPEVDKNMKVVIDKVKRITNDNHKSTPSEARNDIRISEVLEKLKNRGSNKTNSPILIDTVSNPELKITTPTVNLKQKPRKEDLTLTLEKLTKCFLQWLTLETYVCLHGEQKVRSILSEDVLGGYFEKLHVADLDTAQQVKYMSICKRLQLQELAEEKFDSAILSTHGQIRPLPDYGRLKDEGKEMNVKVKAFYSSGVFEKDNTKFPRKKGVEECEDMPSVLPAADAHSQNAMRKKIFITAVTRHIQNHVNELELSESTVADVHALIKTFKLEADNIVFKSSVWIVIALVLIIMLSVGNEELKKCLATPEAVGYRDMILTKCSASDTFLKQVLNVIEHVDIYAERYISTQ